MEAHHTNCVVIRQFFSAEILRELREELVTDVCTICTPATTTHYFINYYHQLYSHKYYDLMKSWLKEQQLRVVLTKHITTKFRENTTIYILAIWKK